MINCADCKHWTNIMMNPATGESFGECSKAESTDGMSVNKPTKAWTAAEGSGAVSWLTTLADFGCVMGER